MQFQVQKNDLAKTQIITPDNPIPEITDGEILTRVEKFGFSANNITYGVAGDTLGYWQFFPPTDANAEKWGIIPVWGFAEVTASNAEGVKTGERLFGYFPPASHLVMRPDAIADDHFFDATDHRSQLPKGYNLYRRVDGEPGYDPAGDDLRMLLYPLYLTAFCLWDQLQENNWYDAQQVLIISASSKTSIGLAYALKADGNAPKTVGLTSKRNMDFVKSLGIYDDVIAYDSLEQDIENAPAAIVDMSGNAQLLGQLHTHLADNMKMTLNVGLTHWEGERKDPNINRDRSTFFFAPSRVQQRIKDWGLKDFTTRSNNFVQKTATQSGTWLELKELNGLDGLASVYDDVLFGKNPPHEGLVVRM